MANRTSENLLWPLLTHMQWHILKGHMHKPSPTCRASWPRAPETQYARFVEGMGSVSTQTCSPFVFTKWHDSSSYSIPLRFTGPWCGVKISWRLTRRLSSPIISQTVHRIFQKLKVSTGKTIPLMFYVFLNGILPLFFWMNRGAHFLWKVCLGFPAVIYFTPFTEIPAIFKILS